MLVHDHSLDPNARMKRQIFKVQYPLQSNTAEIHILIYNRDRSVLAEFHGEDAKDVIRAYNLSTTKSKIFVYGEINPQTKQLELESRGELSREEWPSW